MGGIYHSSLTIEVTRFCSDRKPDFYRTNFSRKYILFWITMKKELFCSTYFVFCKALPNKYLFEQPVLPLHVIGNSYGTQNFLAAFWHFWWQNKTSPWIRKQLSWSFYIWITELWCLISASSISYQNYSLPSPVNVPYYFSAAVRLFMIENTKGLETKTSSWYHPFSSTKNTLLSNSTIPSIYSTDWMGIWTSSNIWIRCWDNLIIK